MMPAKSVFLKTYGKQTRKPSKWILLEDRRQAFDTTPSTDGDTSAFEPAKPTREKRRRVAGRKAARPAKKEAVRCLSEKSCDVENIGNEENVIIPSPAPPPQQSMTTRRKRMSVCSTRAGRLARRGAVLCPTENSSDEENIGRPSPPGPQPAQQSKTTRKCQLLPHPGVLKRLKSQWAPMTSESEGDSFPKCHKNSAQTKRGSNVNCPSVGRFVTRRKCGAAAKPRLPKAPNSILNSSDDFTCGAFCSSKILQPSRRRVPNTFLVSSAENSMNAAGTSSFATKPLREISLNESADHSLGPYPRNLIFCSTPSAGSFGKRPHLKPFPISDKSSSCQFISVSCIGVKSPFQEDPHSSPPVGLRSEEKLPADRHHQEDPSGDLFMEPESTNQRSSCSEDARSSGKDSKAKDAGEVPSLNLLSTDGESISDFVSAAGALEWLIEALKEKCLTEPCTVQLERVNNLTVTQLCSETTYSSCLGLSSAVHGQQTNELSADAGRTADFLQSSEASFNLHSSASDNEIERNYLKSVNSFESPERAASATDSSPSADHKQSADCSSALYDGPTHGTHHTEFTVKEVEAVKERCLSESCTVQLKKLTVSQLQQLFTKQREAPLTCQDTTVHPDGNKCEEGRTHHISDPDEPAGNTRGMMVSARPSVSSGGPGNQAQSSGRESDKKAAVLKRRCVADKPAVEIKRITLSQMKEIRQLKEKQLKSPTVVSDSASDEQIKENHQSESDTNLCDEDASVKVVNGKKRSSASSDEKEAEKSSAADLLPKRKRMSLVPREKRRRSKSTERPGTTRKACVSGLSVNRWRNKGALAGGGRAADCSITELLSTQRSQPRALGTTTNVSTPLRTSPLNLSSLLSDFTPNKHTWSRLKAALSIHRKVLLTPSSLHLSGSPGRTDPADISQDLFATPYRRLLPKHLQSQPHHDSMDACEEGDLSDAEKVYAECGQEQPLAWEECVLPHRMKRCAKIGEGTFGEVFSTTGASGDTVALKIIPVEGSEKVNGEDQKSFGEILHEIIISKELSRLKEKQQNQTQSFIGLNDLHCVRGGYPPDFLKAWDAFDRKKGSENDRPDFFERDQLFIILEFEFGGSDLENSNGKLASLGVAKSILLQVTAALAVAEQELHFEHRDLHWGNVLVKTTKQKTASFLLNGTTQSLETKGVLVRIIDYSLSRLEIDDLTVSCDISKDEELFMGQGDYQFDIYRLMRQENGNNWSDFHPHTNVLWLHYLCSKLLSMKYRGSRGRAAKDTRVELTRFYDNVLQYSSATEALQKCPMFH